MPSQFRDILLRMTQKSFNEQYARLNASQKEAVDAIEGPVMVVAGPGTGKTTILTLRVANILKRTDTPPDAILALTFTESGVHSMRQKLVESIGSSAYKVHIHTFHSFCNDIIQTYRDEFPRVVGSEPASLLDQIRILEGIFEKHSFDILKPYGNIYYYARPALRAISDIKRENISVDAFDALVTKQEERFNELPERFHEKGIHKGKLKGEFEKIKKRIEKNKELFRVYDLYEKALAKAKFYDYDDMILEVIRKIERDPSFRLVLQEEYQYILADEHQDANASQNRLLELLSSFHDNPNLFVVGDEKQAIYRFQGASLKNFIYFKNKYSGAKLINLQENYRSSQAILDMAHGLIGYNVLPLDIGGDEFRVRLSARSAHKEERHIYVAELETPRSEMEFVARDIRNKIASGVSPQEIAVLYRDNADAFPLAEALEHTDIPFVILSNEDALSDPVVRNFITLLRAIHSPEDEYLGRVLYFDFLNLPHLDVWKVQRYRFEKRLSLIDLLRANETLSRAGVSEPQIFTLTADRVLRWGKRARNENAAVLFERVLRESGFLAHVLALSNSADVLGKIDKLLSEIQRLVQNHKEYELEHFLGFLDLLETHEVAIESSSRRPFVSAVNLLTAHKSKGLEFEHVYIIRAVDGHWGNKRRANLFDLPIFGESFRELDDLPDERRLFYVAITRARRSVTITLSKTREDGKCELPSQFVEELDKTLYSKVAVAESEYHSASLGAKGKGEGKSVSRGLDVKDREYIRHVFLEEGLSVTALNNFLSCPWKYFFLNLIRLPQTPLKHQLYGNAVHNALSEFFNAYAKGGNATKSKLLEIFERSLIHQPLSKDDFRESLARGDKALSGYYDAYNEKGVWRKDLITEFNIAGVFVPLNSETNLLIKGRLDKIEILDGGGRVNVVDYKTGKPRSRNEILGDTKNSKGNMKRQLDFYKLLLDSYENSTSIARGVSKYEMVSGEIDFVEPNDRGKYKKELFEITSGDVAKVKEEVIKVGNEILSISFWEKKCDDKECEWCRLRALSFRT